MRNGLQIRLLGPLEATVGGRAVDVSGARLRGLLARLAIDAPHPVTSSALIDALWPGEPPTDAANALQSLVSRLRKALGDPALVVQTGAGYQLLASRDDVDVHRFSDLARSGREKLRAGEPAGAAAALREALELFRGPVQTWSEAPEAVAFEASVDDQRLEATADRVDAELELGRAADVIAELDALVAKAPLRERFTALLMRALASTGRQSEALDCFESLRARLAEELGVDPSPELTAAHLSVLRGEFAPARPASTTRPVNRGNLRHALTSFVGRENEVSRIGKLLDEARLITLVGPGGAGKTRLATVAADAFVSSPSAAADGAWLAELAPLSDADDVPLAVLDALGLRETTLLDRASATTPVTGSSDPVTRLIDALASRNTLLVLDNCEHLVDPAAALADQLLSRCPDLRILATSREPLGIVGETLVAVPPLRQPAPDVSAPEALHYPSVQLFGDRAAAVSPGFEVDADTVGPVVEIVRRLDGLPLAIELAAARLRGLPVREIAERLGDRFRLLTGGNRAAVPRHRTLRAVVEWSWELLSDAERLLAERLAVFSGTICPSAAASVCARVSPDDPLADADIAELLASLTDKSLLQPATEKDGSARYRMLETLREFGLTRLGERAEVVPLRRRHAEHFADLVREAGPHLRRAEQLEWMALVDTERENILAALRFLCDDGQAQTAIDIVVELAVYWTFTGRHADTATWLNLALNAEGAVDDSSRLVAESFWILSLISADTVNDSTDVDASFAKMHDLSERLDRADSAHPMLALVRPVVAMFADRGPRRTLELADEGITSSDPWIAAAVRLLRAAVKENQGDMTSMRVDAEIALEQFRAIGDRWGIASCLGMLAEAKTIDEDLDGAIAALTEAVSLAKEQLAGHDDAMMLSIRLADLRMRQGDRDEAKRVITAIRDESEPGRGYHTVFLDLLLADFARTEGDLAQAREIRDRALEQVARFPQLHPAQGHLAAVVAALSAKIDVDDGNLAAAAERLRAALRYAIGAKDMPILATVGVAVAAFASADGRAEDAARTLGACARLRGGDDVTQPDIARLTAELTAKLGDARWQQLYDTGRSLSPGAARRFVEQLAV